MTENSIRRSKPRQTGTQSHHHSDSPPLIPLNSNILVRLLPRKSLHGSIFIPHDHRPRSLEGFVVSVGPGRLSRKGVRIPTGLSTGDHVVVPRYYGHEIKRGDCEYILIDSSDILAVLEPNP